MPATLRKEVKNKLWSTSTWHEADIYGTIPVQRSSQHQSSNNYQIPAFCRVSVSPAKVSENIIFKLRTL